MSHLENLVGSQKAFFRTGQSKGLHFRIKALKHLKKTIRHYEEKVLQALREDFSKPPTETYLSELYTVYDEIDYAIRHLPAWMRDQKVPTPLLHFRAKSKIISEPLGTVFIISPWNYPFSLAMSPLVGALAAGNTAILRPSGKTPATAKVMSDILKEAFPEAYVAMVVEDYGGVREIIEAGVDYVLFTGGQDAAKRIASTCASQLIPYTLELGGKSPALVLEDAPIKRTAQRLVWGKFLNAGQTCIAPDHVYVHASIKTNVIEALKKEIVRFYGPDPLNNSDLASINNPKAWDRLDSALRGVEVIHGGNRDRSGLRIAPTLVDAPRRDDQLMQEEIFGPILPILTFEDLGSLVEDLQDKPKPLALYVFTQSQKSRDYVLDRLSFGGGCVNDTLIHYANAHLPFGGVGQSGMGAYHGKASFDSFSHQKAITERGLAIELPIRHAPYTFGALLRKGLRLFRK